MGTGAVAGAVGLLVTLQGDLERLRKAGVVSYETHKSAEETGLSEKQLKTLVKMGWAQKSEDGKYYTAIKNKGHL
jgi:Holliday junction resolvasome RuvABC DNA-binding subunit